VAEGEPRAATISGIAAIVLAAAGVLLWLRRGQSQKPGEPRAQPDDASTPVEPQGQG
jgi:uncharacterized iron-regulated membrane protein